MTDERKVDERPARIVSRHRSVININETPSELATLPFPILVPNQNWAIINYVDSDTSPKSKGAALRIFGTFASLAEADRVAADAIAAGFTYFDLDIVEICHGHFPLPPPSDDVIGEVKYSNHRIHKLMSDHRDGMNKNSDLVEDRAESANDTRSPVEVFETMVAKEALRMFKEWKVRGKPNSKKTIRKTLKKRFDDNIQTLIKQTHGSDANTPLDKKATAALAKRAEEYGIVTTTNLPPGAIVTKPIRGRAVRRETAPVVDPVSPADAEKLVDVVNRLV